MPRVPGIGVTPGQAVHMRRDRGFPNWPVPNAAAATATLTADVAAHTKGAYTEFIASTVAHGNHVLIQVKSTVGSATATDTLLDIALGGAGSEQVIIPNVPIGYISSTGGIAVTVPVNVPRGSRVSGRIQSLQTTPKTAIVDVTVMAGPGRAPAAVLNLGANTATSTGIALPSSNTYVEFSSGLAQPCRGLIVVPAGVSAGGNNHASETTLYTLGVGASGSEVTVAMFEVDDTVAEAMYTRPPGGDVLPGHFPAGTRVALKQSVGRAYRGAAILAVPYA